ncbi:hypothetical protein amrb99_97190 [Actinomadura sp. RB99]|nr:hypothetical protein [Actinomadura sp. RB99]
MPYDSGRSTACDDSSLSAFSLTIFAFGSVVPNSPCSHGLQTSATHSPFALRVVASRFADAIGSGLPSGGGMHLPPLVSLCGSAALNAALVADDTFVPRVVKSAGRATSQISATIAATIQTTPSVTLLARRRTSPHQASHIAPRMTTHDQ